MFACLGGNSCCTEESPCYENEGDCDTDEECRVRSAHTHKRSMSFPK